MSIQSVRKAQQMLVSFYKALSRKGYEVCRVGDVNEPIPIKGISSISNGKLKLREANDNNDLNVVSKDIGKAAERILGKGNFYMTNSYEDEADRGWVSLTYTPYTIEGTKKWTEQMQEELNLKKRIFKLDTFSWNVLDDTYEKVKSIKCLASVIVYLNFYSDEVKFLLENAPFYLYGYQYSSKVVFFVPIANRLYSFDSKVIQALGVESK